MDYPKSATGQLVDFICRTEFDDLPPDVVKKTKQLVLDTIGAALGGYLTDLGAISQGIVERLGGNPESTIIGSGRKTSCANAAFVNAKIANALDCDDVFYNGAHFASPTIAAALALGETRKASGKDIINAIALGYDATARVGVSCIQPTIALSFAWHAVGSVISAAKMMRLDKKTTLNALGIACANAPVTCLWKSWPETMARYGDMGLMASQGIIAAIMAEMGHTGSEDVLEGEFGFWRYIGAERCDYDILLRELGKMWYVMESAIKPYPACRWVQPALDIFTKMVRENNLKPADIEKVIVRTHERAVGKANVYDPDNWLIAQVSIPYNIALAMFGIPPSSEWQTPELYKNPEILSFHRKVVVEIDPDAAGIIALDEQPTYGYRRGSTSVDVVAKGNTFKARTEYAKGDPWIPEMVMTDAELKDKFRAFSTRLAGPSLRWHRRIEEIIEKVDNLEKMDDISELMRILAP